MGKKSKRPGQKAADPDEAGLKWAVGCLLAIGLPLAALGLLIALAVGVEFWQWVDMHRWVETPATILESELVTEPSDEGGATFHVTARYDYEFAGKRYESARVALHEGGDNLGQFHHNNAAALKQARESGRPHPCFVNPRDPDQAILFRDLRPGIFVFQLLAGLIIGGMGALLSFMGWFGPRALRREKALKNQHPGKPWMWRPDWAAGRIRSTGAFLVWFVTFFAIVWNGAVWPICYVIWSGQRDVTVNERWLLGIFPLAGALVALWGVYLWWRRIKWGVSELELAAVPGVLGGPLGGLIHAPRGIDSRDGYFLTLKCLRKVTTNIGGSSSTDDHIEWEREVRVPREAALSARGRTVIPVQIIIPYDLPASDGKELRWMLEARAETRGVDYWAEFEVPVFKTAASSKDVMPVAAEELSEAGRTIGFEEVLARMGASLEREAASGARTIVFPRGRNRGLALYSLAFVVGWTALAAYLFTIAAPWYVTGLVIALDALAILAVVIHGLLRSTMEFGPRGVVRQWRAVGLGSRAEFLPGQIAAIRVKRSGSRLGDTVYRQVVLDTSEGKEHTLAGEIACAPDAERLAAEIRAALAAAVPPESSEPAGSPVPLSAELPEELGGRGA